ncbi:MAG: phosphoribosylamine--glycine ligase [Clostridiales bacterium]|nr:phosphoribosylamine--glycine ligase [Clostridiales bacterium]
MKVLVIGSGGREHVICWKLKQSPRIKELFCTPGNGGIATIADCVPIKADDIDGIIAFASEKQIDFVMVAPENPLALGLVDRLQEHGIRAFGPSAAAARIESSKAFSKDLMVRYNIPTAQYRLFDNEEDALKYVATVTPPAVVKADGLALGKGVIIARDEEAIKDAVRAMFSEKKFGDAGDKVLIEECLEGPELTILAFTDGDTVLPMVSSRDHKRALDHDLGKNTGGMGAITPGAELSAEQEKEIFDSIIAPTIAALRSEGTPFVGVIYFGLMLTNNGPKVIEYNARFGDPEAQAILPRMENDLLEVFEACVDHTLDRVQLKFKPGGSCCVVLASGGYPDQYDKGFEIRGIETCGKQVFHAGTHLSDGKFYTSGGRVLCVYADALTTDEAIDLAYEGVKNIRFQGMHYRTDIGRTGTAI